MKSLVLKSRAHRSIQTEKVINTEIHDLIVVLLLLGIEPVEENGRGQDNRLWRRFRQVEKLPPNQCRPIIQFLDAFLEKEKLKKAS